MSSVKMITILGGAAWESALPRRNMAERMFRSRMGSWMESDKPRHPHQVSRSAAAIGSLAARMAGKRPPINPSAADQMIAVTSREGVTAKENVT